MGVESSKLQKTHVICTHLLKEIGLMLSEIKIDFSFFVEI